MKRNIFRILGIFRRAARYGCLAAVLCGTAHAQTALEIPAPIAGGQERIIRHIGYTVGYNGQRRLPNWVAYELTPEETSGPAARQNRFVPDPEVPPHESATTDDYRHSGYDRGHMAPAGDMKWSEQAMRESFYLSNICPQHPALNRGIWKRLEDLVRRQAATRGSIYVVCGPITAVDAPRIGRQGVAVPQRFFKALLQEAGGGWSAIGFVFENGAADDAAGASDDALRVHTLSIDSLERLTGMDFFPSLPDSIETVVERETDLNWWGL
ncbi:MAG: DNA/RNA non-specific endonuclease [Bacteroidales bacterium]|nr:DNA/RNA non-specific endonuclease [Bacteroidales bacterium]